MNWTLHVLYLGDTPGPDMNPALSAPYLPFPLESGPRNIPFRT